MNQPASICSITTIDTINEFLGLMHSVWCTMPEVHLHISCCKSSADVIKRVAANIYPEMSISIDKCMDMFARQGRVNLERNRLLELLVLEKMRAMKFCLEHFTDCLYVDSDVIFLERPVINKLEYKLFLSPSFIDRDLEGETGCFNAGYIWSSDVECVNTWESLIPYSKYYDQQCLDELSVQFKHCVFHAGHNIMPWRLLRPRGTVEEYFSSYSNRGSDVFYTGCPLTSIHTHLLRPDFKDFNRHIISLLIPNRYKSSIEAYAIINKYTKYGEEGAYRSLFR